MKRISTLNPHLEECFAMSKRRVLYKVLMVSAIAFAASTSVQSQVKEVTAATANASQFDFAYRSSDNRVNVFDDGRDTRLQLPEGTLVPTVVVIQPKGEVVLKAHREDPYLVVPGIHQQIRLRWANSREVAVSYSGIAQVTQRLGQAASFGSSAPVASHGSAAKPAPVMAQSGTASSPAMATMERTSALGAFNAQANNMSAPATAAASMSFSISRSDRTVREALVRWAKDASWTFDAEHWTVPVDLPIVASASLGTDFRGAVRAMLDSTALSDMPLQPCFYSNQVLRVVPKAERCDRM